MCLLTFTKEYRKSCENSATALFEINTHIAYIETQLLCQYNRIGGTRVCDIKICDNNWCEEYVLHFFANAYIFKVIWLPSNTFTVETWCRDFVHDTYERVSAVSGLDGTRL